jgi:hypothetical protein
MLKEAKSGLLIVSVPSQALTSLLLDALMESGRKLKAPKSFSAFTGFDLSATGGVRDRNARRGRAGFSAFTGFDLSATGMTIANAFYPDIMTFQCLHRL